jgi:hypothetical protein
VPDEDLQGVGAGAPVLLDDQHRLAIVQEVRLLDAHEARLVDRRDPIAWRPPGADLAQWDAVAGEVGLPSLGAHAQAARRTRPGAIAATARDQQREGDERGKGSHASARTPQRASDGG